MKADRVTARDGHESDPAGPGLMESRQRSVRRVLARLGAPARDAARRARNRRVLARHRVAPPAGADEVSWLFVATLPNSGSTALSALLASAPCAVTLQARGEGQWLVPELCAPGRRWDPELPVDYALVRAVWLDAALRAGVRPCLVVEKSPPNLVRLRELLAAFDGMPAGVLRLTRDPYAICASWARRYPPAKLAREWAPELAGRLHGEADFYRSLGAICGERLEMLASLGDLAALTVSYEALTKDPAATAETLRGAFPLLDGFDPAAQVRVKDYAPGALSNMNAAQTGRLTPAQIEAITEGLAPHQAAVTALGYALR